jgi:tetratricopeptide (TPR) repeat protein/class 3 adenylate cyclase
MPRVPLTPETKMPAGRVTIVYTDLSDSSGILPQLGSHSYRENLLDPYIERLEKLLEPGIIFQFKGDGFIAVFQHARDALESAVRLQRDLMGNKITFTDRDSQQTYEMITRVSIYTSPGEVVPHWQGADGWQYVYEATNLAARLEGLGNGGQILAAQTTIEKIAHSFDVPWIKWEARALRNHPGPIDIYEILWDKDENPEGRGEPGPRFLSPMDFGERIRFIRRPVEEDAVINALLDSAPHLVTIHASGGMGKTRLSRHCAAESEIITRFPDGIHIILLENSQRSVESIKETICTSLGWKPAEFTLKSLRDQLMTQRRLLVLDNYESIQCDAVRDYLNTFIVNGAPLRLLVTSRHPVGLGQAQERRISLEEGMTDDEATELLLDRLRAQKGPNWNPTEPETTALREIREAAENNNPLALELIAAWANSTYSLPDIAARLKERLVSRLTSTPRGIAPFDGKTRHLSLQDSLEWSWSMLRETENGPFLIEGMPRLSLFPATFTRETVEKAFGYNEDEADDLLTGLYNASLLRETEIEGVKRFYFHRATREYATDKLKEQPNASRLRSSFVDYWLKWQNENNNIGDLATLDRLRQEWQNVLAASQIAESNSDWERVGRLSALVFFLHFEGLYAEAVTLLIRTLSSCDALNQTQQRGKILNNLGHVYQAQNKFFEAEEAFKQSLVISRQFNDRASEGMTLNNMGIVYRAQNRFSEAEKAFKQSLKIYREFKNKSGEGKALNNLGGVYREQNKAEKAEKAYKLSLAIKRASKDRVGEGATLNNLGIVYSLQNRLDVAEKAYIQTLRINQEFKDRVSEGTTLSNLGHVYQKQNKFDEAEKVYNQSLKIYREISDKVGEGLTLMGLGVAYKTQNRFSEAEKAFNQSLAIKRKFKDRVGEGQVLENVALLEQQRGNLKEAVRFAQEAVEVLKLTQAVSSMEKAQRTLEWLEAEMRSAQE